MKQCQKCNRSYDDSQSFCLMDGTPLIIEPEVETKVVPKSPVREKRIFLWLFGLLGGIILMGSGLALGLLINNYNRQDSPVADNRQTGGGKLSQSPTVLFSPTVTPDSTNSSPVQDSSPGNEALKPTPDKVDEADITPIDWSTTPSGFKGEDGQIYTFRCPEEGTENIIWGSDIYTMDSSICTAAVHTGRITLAGGGIVTIEFRPGRSIYGSTLRNGIKSRTYGEYPRSFVVR